LRISSIWGACAFPTLTSVRFDMTARHKVGRRLPRSLNQSDPRLRNPG
jgi:hypothetical protein